MDKLTPVTIPLELLDCGARSNTDAPTVYGWIRFLNEREAPTVNVRLLSFVTGASASRVSRAVSWLERRGWIRKANVYGGGVHFYVLDNVPDGSRRELESKIEFLGDHQELKNINNSLLNEAKSRQQARVRRNDNDTEID